MKPSNITSKAAGPVVELEKPAAPAETCPVYKLTLKLRVRHESRNNVYSEHVYRYRGRCHRAQAPPTLDGPKWGARANPLDTKRKRLSDDVP
ncbi:hypothetical protein EVAR_71421_1 [Eumeta japonica]|uniref:Uncharacterized protein n=1 Tax=Eumeta variegata TaxID=151549 RepID=A0A4C2AC38_EUMVA|nr:hypothetical protein EVAR_71421_1 [Eumeta japonica]